MNKTDAAIHTAAWKWNKKQKIENTIEKNPATDEFSFETSESEVNTSKDSDYTDESKICGKKSAKSITIQLSSKVWNTIGPKESLCKRKVEGSHTTGVRKYIILEEGLWSGIVAQEISKHKDVPCVWSFKRNRVYLSGNKHVEFEGKCNTCKAVLVGTIKEKPKEDEPVKINIEIFDIVLERHEKEAKKVKLTSKAAEKLYTQNKNATVIRRNLLKDTTQMFTEPTSRTMTANAVRCFKYRQRKKEKISECPITSLLILKLSHKYMNCIQYIGLYPFYVIYCSPEQAKLFNVFKKKNKILKVSCDATGGIVHKIGLFSFCSDTLPCKSLETLVLFYAKRHILPW